MSHIKTLALQIRNLLGLNISSKVLSNKDICDYMDIFISESQRIRSSVIDLQNDNIKARIMSSSLRSDLCVLASLGYISFEHVVNVLPSSITITDKGLAFFESRRESTRKFLINSILVPIAVSVITSFIAHTLFSSTDDAILEVSDMIRQLIERLPR